VAYSAVGWVIIQVATAVFPVLQIPAWAMRLVVVLVLLGSPIALVIACVAPPFQRTPVRRHAWDPVRQHPRFQKILASLAPK
jgi:hypothetical protein